MRHHRDPGNRAFRYVIERLRAYQAEILVGPALSRITAVEDLRLWVQTQSVHVWPTLFDELQHARIHAFLAETLAWWDADVNALECDGGLPPAEYKVGRRRLVACLDHAVATRHHDLRRRNNRHAAA